jgi:hypothetical protein
MTLQAGSDKHVSVTGSGPLPAITAGKATHTNEIAGKLTSGDSSDVCQLWVAEEASDDLR